MAEFALHMKALVERYVKTYRGLSRDVWLLALVMLINRSGSMVLPFLTLYLTDQGGYTLTQAGMVMSCFGAGSLLGNFFGGWLTDRWKYLHVQVTSFVLGGVMWLVIGQADTLLEMCVAVFLASTFGDMFRPANLTALEIHGTPETRTRALSLNRLAINLGFSIGPAGAGLLIATLGYSSLFWIDALTCWVAAIVLVIGLRPKYQQPRETLSTEELTSPPVAAISPYRDGRFILFLLCQVLVIMAFMQIFFTMPVFWKEHVHLTEQGIGWLMTLNGLLIVAFEMPLIYQIEHRRGSIYWIQAGSLLIAAGYLVLGLGASVWWSVIFICLITFGEILNFPFGSAYALSLAHPSYRGRYMGLYGVVFSGAFILSPPLGTYVAQHFGFFWFTFSISMLAFLGWTGLQLMEYVQKGKIPRADGTVRLGKIPTFRKQAK